MSMDAPEQVVVRTPEYEVATFPLGAYLVVRVRGRYADALLDDLRNRVFLARTSFALDVAGLADMAPAFYRELQYTADLLKATRHKLVLVNPPDRVRSALSLLSGGASIGYCRSEAELAEGGETDRRPLHEAKELDRIQAALKEDKRWQVTDRLRTWICPFCGAAQPDAVLPAAADVPAAVAERVYRHVWSKCPKFAPLQPVYLPAAEMEAAVAGADRDKIVVTRKQMSAIETKITSLEDKARRGDQLAESMRIASDRQRRLLPAKPPDFAAATIDIVYRPAEHISGDFYDFLPMDDGRMGFIIGDVSGHGIEAGILMGMAKKVLLMRLEELGDPVDTVLRANADLFRELDRLSFVTACVAVADPAARTLTLARAGHNPPILFNPLRAPDHLLMEPSGTGLGLTKDAAFEDSMKTQVLPLEAGDLFLLYTDGLVEARGADGGEFGVERMLALLRRNVGSPPAFLLSSLANEMDRFAVGPQEDDVTAVAVQFR